ncbi:MAG: hypothetical protein MH252_10180 [Thermosynechococcaceae cyanobacterium MS004]|nr:hypothetical protein [Thermosynechococcaceae cyanobacterium MS004]
MKRPLGLNGLNVLALNVLVLNVLSVNALVFTAPFSAIAQPKSRIAETGECRNAIARGRSRIERSNAKVVEVVQHPNDAPDRPAGKNIGYSFGLMGPGTQSVLRSQRFLTAVSTDIISNCKTVGTVTFGVSQTDDSQTYGLMKSGKVEAFKCADPGRVERQEPILWGEQICA